MQQVDEVKTQCRNLEPQSHIGIGGTDSFLHRRVSPVSRGQARARALLIVKTVKQSSIPNKLSAQSEDAFFGKA